MADVTGMLLQGRDEEALAICNKARTGAPFDGGFGSIGNDGAKSFLDLAIEWITNSRRSRSVN